MARFAIVTVVDAPDADHAYDYVADSLAPGGRSNPANAESTRFVGEALEVAEHDEYETRALATAIVTHPELPGGEGYTIHHVAGEGFWFGIGGAEYGPYDCPEQEAIKRAFHDSASG